MSMISSISSVSYHVAEKEISVSSLKSRNLEYELTSEQQRLNKLSGDSTLSEAEKIKEKWQYISFACKFSLGSVY